MQPYYEHNGITLYHCKWEELTLADNSVNLLLADPNYGTTNLAWDTPWDWPRFWTTFNVACPRPALQVLFSQQPFTTDLIISNRKAYRYEIIWRKTRPTRFMDANRRPLSIHENIEVFCRAFGESTYNPQMGPLNSPERARQYHKPKAAHYGNQRAYFHEAADARYPTDVWDIPSGHNAGDHQTPKPLTLLERLLLTYSNPGDLVCDPGFGRGTTARAAKNFGRRFVGCDMREECAERAARWCEQEVLPLEVA
jgi:site-specific DNA-methyltransferase (adenine-specific)